MSRRLSYGLRNGCKNFIGKVVFNCLLEEKVKGHSFFLELSLCHCSSSWNDLLLMRVLRHIQLTYQNSTSTARERIA